MGSGQHCYMRDSVCAALVLLLASLAVFSQALFYPFVWDDVVVHLQGNPHFAPFSPASLVDIWTTPYGGLYIPFTYSLWGGLSLLSQALTGVRFHPMLFHGVNLLLHCINAQLVYLLLRRLSVRFEGSLIGALLFLLHPVQVEAVVWVSEFRGLMATALGLGALLCYLRYLESGGRGHYVWGLLLFTFALLSKPNVAVIPLLLPVLDRWHHRATPGLTVMRLLPWVGVVLLIVVVTYYLQALDVKGQPLPVVEAWQRPFLYGATLAFYLVKLVYPVHLSPDYGLNPGVLSAQPWFWFGWLLPLVLLYGAWRYAGRRSLLLLAVLWFMVALLPVSGLLDFSFMLWSLVADRYLYLGMVGVALAYGVFTEWSRRQVRLPVAWTLLLACALLSALGQVPLWQHPLTLWNHAVELNPNDPRVYVNRSVAYQGLGNWDRAARDLAMSQQLWQATSMGSMSYPEQVSPKGLLQIIESDLSHLRPGAAWVIAYLSYRTGDVAAALNRLDGLFRSMKKEEVSAFLGRKVAYSTLDSEEKIRLLLAFMERQWAEDETAQMR